MLKKRKEARPPPKLNQKYEPKSLLQMPQLPNI